MIDLTTLQHVPYPALEKSVPSSTQVEKKLIPLLLVSVLCVSGIILFFKHFEAISNEKNNGNI
jgi:cell division protein FtsL